MLGILQKEKELKKEQILKEFELKIISIKQMSDMLDDFSNISESVFKEKLTNG